MARPQPGRHGTARHGKCTGVTTSGGRWHSVSFRPQFSVCG